MNLPLTTPERRPPAIVSPSGSDRLWSLEEALGNLAAALPDVIFAKHYDTPREVLERISAAYDAAHFATLSASEALSVLEQGCPYLEPAWRHAGGPDPALVARLSQTIAHFKAELLISSSQGGLETEEPDAPTL